MKKLALLCAVAVALVGGMSLEAEAQQTPQIAMIDLAHVYHHHPQYQAMKNDLKTAVDLAELEIKQRRDKCRDMAERLATLDRNSPEFQTVEQTLTKETAGLNVHMQLERKRLADQEGKMLLAVYKDVQEEIAAFCKQNGVRVVMRHNGSESAETNEQVVALLSRQVIYHDPAVDITEVILQKVQIKHGGATDGGVPATVRQPVGGTQGFRPR